MNNVGNLPQHTSISPLLDSSQNFISTYVANSCYIVIFALESSLCYKESFLKQGAKAPVLFTHVAALPGALHSCVCIRVPSAFIFHLLEDVPLTPQGVLLVTMSLHSEIRRGLCSFISMCRRCFHWVLNVGRMFFFPFSKEVSPFSFGVDCSLVGFLWLTTQCHRLGES